MNARLRYCVLGLCLGTTAVAAAAGAWASSANFFRIATGATVGTYFPIGRLIASAITNPPGSRACEDGGSCGVPGLIAVANSTDGALDNIQLIARGMVESGFVQADLADWAYRGKGLFQTTGKLDNLRVIARLYAESVHIVAAGQGRIRRVADLEGLRVSIGSRESGVPERALMILSAYGIGIDDFITEYHEPSQAANRLRDGRLDAMFVIGGFPIPVVSDLTRDGLVELLPIDGPSSEALLKQNPHFRRDEIRANAYRGIGARATLSVGALWLTSSAVDARLVYAITRALWDKGNREMLDGGHPKGRKIMLKSAVEDVPLPLHDGAERFYRERDLIQ